MVHKRKKWCKPTFNSWITDAQQVLYVCNIASYVLRT